jgi:demethylmenaquinone methyltransferase/2-methoxy-6-polyprenyl-1,4-benzoquinol methylase
MSHLTEDKRASYVQAMFGRIAGRYDLLNRLMTFGRDHSWRLEAIRRLALPLKARVLDVGSGTGDIAFELALRHPDALVVASDFTIEMVQVGRARPFGEKVAWVIADAQRLPFAADCFDGVISGFLLRNVPDVPQTLREQLRVLKSGGRAASVDTTPPRDNLLRPFIEFHLHTVIPLLGKLVAGDAEAYRYLPSSTEGFLPAEVLAERFRQAGFRQVGFVRRMFGTVGIHWGRKNA